MITKVFIAVVIGSGVISIGCNIALTGIVISNSRNSTSGIKMTSEQESWFGEYFEYEEK